MNIAIVGATGMIGKAITTEALSRGHDVTAVSRTVARSDLPGRVAVATGDVLDADSIAAAVKGHDVVLAAVSARLVPLSEDNVPEVADDDEDWSVLPRMADSLLEALPTVGVDRLIWIGGAGGLEVSPGVRVMDAPGYGQWPEVDAHLEALKRFRTSGSSLRWSVFSAPENFNFGDKTGGRLIVAASDEVIRNQAGESIATIGDAAAAIVDEAENESFVRERFTLTVEPVA